MNPIEEHRPDEWELYCPLHGTRMLELGGKWCSQAGVTYKSVFESLGFEHVSIDWNGQHGALKRDLRQPLWEEFEPFHTVSNIGTTEHVSDQAGVWANIHNLTTVGGVYVHLTPYPDGKSWWWHGEHYPTEKFLEEFAALNGWRIERLYKGREEPFCNLMCRMRKEEDFDFRMPHGNIKRNQRRPRNPPPEGCASPGP